jgi:RNA polymerase sigma-70 factor (ECF subfamily)
MKRDRGNGEGRTRRQGRNGRGAAAKGQKRASAAGDDELIVRSLKKGDQEALKVVMERHHERLFYHVDGICRNSADAEEVLQDTYVTTWTKIGDFKGAASLLTWMYRIAANTALMKRRKEERWRKHTAPLEDSTLLPGQEEFFAPWLRPPECPEQTLLAGELRNEIRRAAGELADIYEEVFLLRDVQGFNIKETCSMLDLRESTAKSRLRRSRLFMQKSLRHYLEVQDKMRGTAAE